MNMNRNMLKGHQLRHKKTLLEFLSNTLLSSWVVTPVTRDTAVCDNIFDYI